MNRKVIFGSVVLVSAVLAAGGFWAWERNEKKADNQISQNEEIEKSSTSEASDHQNETENNSNRPVPPNSEDWRTAEWKVYRDEKNGFEIKYPDSHFVDTVFGNNISVYIRHSDTVSYRKERGGIHDVPELNLVEISVYKNKDRFSLIDWVKHNNESCINCSENSPNRECKNGCSFNKMETLIINGQEVLAVDEPSIVDDEDVYFDLKGKIVKFYVRGLNLKMNDGDNFFKKMMESFKIID
ncbi:MAG: hypothetical protein QG663_1833 [Thermodesulfobacteriota bacterium]|nr:hypothetical protein [Thermodesulfobacteriota bacterium]